MASIAAALLPVLAVDVGIQAVSFAIAAPLKTEKFYDLSGALTYMACVATSLAYSRRNTIKSVGILQMIKTQALHPRQIAVSITTLAWCTRLGTFLAWRIHSRGKDDRFDKVKHKPLVFSVYWALQAVWIFTTAFPVFLINVMPAASLARFGALDVLGLSIWSLGFGIEVLSDSQKSWWQARLGPEQSRKEFINEGLWTWSRHPNYFGEALLWTGNWITCSAAFRHLGLAKWLGISAGLAISPLFVFGLLYRVSGVPLLEKKADKKFGQDPKYLAYKETVPEFFPRLPFAHSDSDSHSKRD